MRQSTMRVLMLIGLAVLALLLIWWLVNPGRVESPAEEPAGDAPAAVESPAEEPVGDAPAAVACPVATPEFFNVEPVTSPTDQSSQVITVDLGNGEVITVTSESGTFSAPFDTFPKEIDIALLPGTTHNLVVEGRVREIVQGGCTYGGYTLTTTTDRYGEPLVIVQEQ